MEALAPLQRLTSRGLSVLLLHHPRKQASAAGMAARGSGALSGFADIIIEMDWYGHDVLDSRRRRLQGYSRFQETPRHLVIELNPAGTDYLTLGDYHEEQFGAHWQVLRAVLEDAHGKLSRHGVLAEWPDDFDKPDKSTLWVWLERAVECGLVLRDGSGRKNTPFRYWLPGQEEKWQDDPFHLPELPPWDDRSDLDSLLPRRRKKKPAEPD